MKNIILDKELGGGLTVKGEVSIAKQSPDTVLL